MNQTSETKVQQDNQIILYKEIKTVITTRTIITTVVCEKINKNNNTTESIVLSTNNKHENLNKNTEIRNLSVNEINILQEKNELDAYNQTARTSNEIEVNSANLTSINRNDVQTNLEIIDDLRNEQHQQKPSTSNNKKSTKKTQISKKINQNQNKQIEKSSNLDESIIFILDQEEEILPPAPPSFNIITFTTSTSNNKLITTNHENTSVGPLNSSMSCTSNPVNDLIVSPITKSDFINSIEKKNKCKKLEVKIKRLLPIDFERFLEKQNKKKQNNQAKTDLSSLIMTNLAKKNNPSNKHDIKESFVKLKRMQM
jgi:hypothetical protein